MASRLLQWACAALLLVLGCMVQLARTWEHASVGEFHGSIVEGTVLVAFVAPDEPKSAAFEGEWLSAAATASETKDGYRLMSIDCSDPENPCDREGVDSPPYILLFQHGGERVTRYQGVRRAAALLHFVTRLSRPAISTLAASELSAFKTADEIVFIAYVDPADPSPGEKLADLAGRYRHEFTFGVVSDLEVARAQGVQVPSVVCYKHVDGDTVSFTLGDAGREGQVGGGNELEAWIWEASRAVVGELTVLNRERLIKRGWPMVYIFAPTEPARQDLRKTLYKFARSYYDSLTVVLVDPFDFPSLLTDLGLRDQGKFPVGAVHQLSKNRIYHYPRDQPLTPGAIQQWGLDVYQGRIKPWTPEGVTTSYDDLGPTRVAGRTVSLANIPGVTIKVAGHDEL